MSSLLISARAPEGAPALSARAPEGRRVPNTAVSVCVRYLGLRLSPALRQAIQTQVERLQAHARVIESCELHVGNWQLHRDAGHVYRVSLEVELKDGRGELISKRQSALDARADVLPEALLEAFDESLARLARLS